MAKFHLRYSAMNSGKTSELIRIAHNYEDQGGSILVAKPGVDTKGGTKVVSRIGLERETDLLVPPTMDVAAEIGPLVVENGLKAILVDEAQFLQPAQVDSLYWDISEDLNTPVIAFGLRADFLSIPFPGSERLLALADELDEVVTLCRCFNKARFNARKIDGRYVFEGDQVAIDGFENVEYESLCKSCYRQEYLADQAAKSILEQHVASPL